MIAFLRFLSNFFRNWAKVARPVWEFRIVYNTDKMAWVIELHDQGDQKWRPLTERSPEKTDNELHIRKFPDYQTALAEANRLGLPLAYEQAHYTATGKPLHPALNAIENNVISTSAGTRTKPLVGDRRSGEVRQLRDSSH